MGAVPAQQPQAPPPQPPPLTSAAARTQPLFPDPAHQPVAQEPVGLRTRAPNGIQDPGPPPLPPAVTPSSQRSPAHPPPSVHVAPEAGVLTVTWGEELYQPRTWHSYRVGPFTISAKLAPGETVSQATKRLMDELAEVADAERSRKRDLYMKMLAEQDQLMSQR